MSTESKGIMSYNILSKLSETIAGSAQSLGVERRLFNIAVFISIIVSFLSLLININLEFHWLLNVIIGSGSLILIYIYLKARWYNKFHIWLYIFCAVFILSGSWLFNEGPFGSINYIYILAFVIFLSITNRKQHFWVSLIIIVNLLVLYSIYYFFPEYVLPYYSEATKESDLVLTYIYVIIFSALIFSSLRRNYENEKVKVEDQKEKIEIQHKHITDSIIYASDIQQALLLRSSELKEFFNEGFVFWEPKDVVSGDFYSIRRLPGKKNQIICAVADCTGHGVPGALLTMLGASFLNETITQNNHLSPGEILDKLRIKIKTALHQGNQSTENRDGMDMSICIIDKENKVLQFAGAHRPIYILRNKKLIEYKGDRMPIGMFLKDNIPFTTHEIDLNENDVVFMFTDGFADQFGQNDGKKFYISAFKELLVKSSVSSISEQENIIHQTFLNWKGTQEQTDDVLILGFKPLS